MLRLQVIKDRTPPSLGKQPVNTQSCVSWFSVCADTKIERISCDWPFPAHCSDLNKQEVDAGMVEVFIAHIDLQLPVCVRVCVCTRN